MAESLRGLAERLFNAVEAKDLDGVLALFTEDGLLFDPHYPTPQMIGKPAITAGLQRGFGTMKTFGFTIENFYLGDDGRSAAAEVASAHVLEAGMRLNFPQAFFFEVRDGKFMRVNRMARMGSVGSCSA